VSAVQRNITLAGRLRRVNRITLVAALAIVALIVVASSFTLGLLSLIDSTRLQAKVLAESASASLMFQDAKSAQELLQPLRYLPELDEAVLSTAAGRVFAHYERPGHEASLKPMPAIKEHHSATLAHIEVAQPVVFEGHREPVGGGPGQSGRRDELGESGRPGLQRAEHDGGLVEHADSATLVHKPILTSQ